jgi:hypothetical protein
MGTGSDIPPRNEVPVPIFLSGPFGELSLHLTQLFGLKELNRFVFKQNDQSIYAEGCT